MITFKALTNGYSTGCQMDESIVPTVSAIVLGNSNEAEGERQVDTMSSGCSGSRW